MPINLPKFSIPIFQHLIDHKFKYGYKYNTGWFVSNCEETSGAVRRYNYGKQLIEAGLKLYSEGKRFNFNQRLKNQFKLST